MNPADAIKQMADELPSAYARLVKQRKIKIMKGHYVMPEITRSYFMRFLYEG